VASGRSDLRFLDGKGMRILSLPRSGYFVAALTLSAMALLGWHEEGLSGVWHFVFLACLAVAQGVRPTLLGWRLLFLLFVVYAVASLVSLLSNPDTDHIVFAVMGAVPAIILYRCRPPRHVNAN
jgi:hypothetical protein